MRVYLGAFLHYTQGLEKNFPIKVFNSIKELDNYTKEFESSKDIKKAYLGDLQEYVLDMRKNKKIYHETKEGKPVMYICAYYINEKGEYNFIPIMYKSNANAMLVPKKSLLKYLREEFQRIHEFIRSQSKYTGDEYVLFKNVTDKFGIRLSNNIIDLMKIYIRNPRKVSLTKLLKEMESSLDSLNEDKLYETLRIKIKEIVLELEKGKIVLKNKVPKKLKLEKENPNTGKKMDPSDHALDEYYNQVVDLLNWKQMYGIDESEDTKGRKR